MNYLDLFHGIGGFALGAYWAGMKFENHFCSDIEPYCQKLYKLRFPDSVQLGDIEKINCDDLLKYGDDWIITGGFPCQDISIAGKGEGIYGKRSGLWFEYWRLIRGIRPRFAIIENVSALTFRGLDRVLADLAEIGYDAEWQDIRASDMGAPHRRERIWIVAYPVSTREWRHEREGKIKKNAMAYPSSIRRNLRGFEREGIQRGKQARNEIDSSREKIPDTEKRRLQGSFEKHGLSQKERLKISRFVFEGSRNGKQYHWSTEPELGRLVNGLPGRVDRLKGLGNAIVPQIAEILFRLIKMNYI